MPNNYLFTSERLGFRCWKSSDIDFLHEMNSSKKVMQYFPNTLSKQESEKFIVRMQQQYQQHELCYFATELIETKTLIGFIGLCYQTYEADFNPSVDIGWRIHSKYWKKGYATEGAKACLDYGFHQLNLSKIIAIAPKINIPSIHVMQKIGMQKGKAFMHPLLDANASLQPCILYEKYQ